MHKGTATSNACIKDWFSADAKLTLQTLAAKSENEKQKGPNRIAFQCPEQADGPCGRTFEDAFILANREKFSLNSENIEALEKAAKAEAERFKKSDFALRFAIEETEWNVPRYLEEGIRWLAQELPAASDPALAELVDLSVESSSGEAEE